MSTQFTPCSACGAVGEVGKKCLFCGTTIILRENAVVSASRVVRKRTVSPQQYAEKISIYHDVVQISDMVLRVSIGKQEGVINLNGDLIYPLGNYHFESSYGSPWIVCLVDKYNIPQYINLNTEEMATKLGYITDKESKRQYRVNIKDWTPINKYIDLEGGLFSFDYLRNIAVSKLIEYNYKHRFATLLCNETECALVIHYDNELDKMCLSEQLNLNPYSLLNHDPSFPMCIIRGIQDFYDIKDDNNKLLLLLRTKQGCDVALTIAENVSSKWVFYDSVHLYNEWCKKTGEKKLQLKTTEELLLGAQGKVSSRRMGWIKVLCPTILILLSMIFLGIGLYNEYLSCSVCSLVFFLLAMIMFNRL